MTVGQAFKKMREKKGYTIVQLAHEIGIDDVNIRNWEKDRHSPSLIWLMCTADIFKCTLDELVGRTTTPK
jgi:DNA-binding XRE family transcriptional regulator